MAWLFLALAGLFVWLVLRMVPESRSPGPRYSRRDLDANARGREQQRREHEERCGGCG